MPTGHHRLVLGPVERRWVSLELASGLYLLDATAASRLFNDPVEDLLEAALGCTQPLIRTVVLLFLEPGGYTLEVDPIDARSVHLTFSYARSISAPFVPPDAETEHECVVDSQAWASAIADGLRRWDPTGWSQNPDRYHERLAELNRRLAR